MDSPSKCDAVKAFIADLARPFAIYATSAGATVATVTIAMKIEPDKLDLSSAAIFIGAVFTGVSAVYAAKAWEASQQSKHDAQVQIAQAAAGTGV